MILVFTIALLFLIFFQDLKSRSVYWIVFPLLFSVNIISSWNTLLPEIIFYNIGFVLFLILSLTLYLSLKNGKLIAVWKGFFSLGDILFILALTPLFGFMEFVYFFTFGTILVLIIFMLTHKWSKNKTIPYAGYLAAISIAYLPFQVHIQSLIAHYYGS